MLKRKITEKLEQMYRNGGKYALLIDGARQVGKTFAIEHFAASRYEVFIEINFIKTKNACAIFENAADEQEILLRLSAFAGRTLKRGQTLVFLDEVQQCPEAVTFIKFLVQEGTCHYVLSGSLLGVELKNIRSVPVGFMDEVRMFPMDFEEFVQANGESEVLLGAAREAWNAQRPLDRVYHDRLLRLFRLYLVVGGMPAVVQTYVETHDISQVVRMQRQIIALYRRDIAQYDEKNALRIRAVFDRIPAELDEKNKRFFATSIEAGMRFEQLGDEFLWLKEAGVALPTINVQEPALPLKLGEKPNSFKLFSNDVGLLAAQYMNGIQLRLLNNDMDINFGAVYENVIAQELMAHGFPLNYYSSNRRGEIDFIVEYNGNVLPIEVKSGKHYKRHNALNFALNDSAYDIREAIVFTDDVMKKEGRILYAPIYMAMFLSADVLPEKMIYVV